jgi:hypothetical protein
MFRTTQWKLEFLDLMNTLEHRANYTELIYDEDRRIFRTVAKMPLEIVKYRLFIPVTCLVIFSTLSFMSTDPITSKPALGIVGVISTGLSLGAAFGLLLMIGFRFTAMLTAVPLLVFGDYTIY